MARKVPGPPSGVLRRFRPKALDNSKDPEPVEVDILQPTEEQRRELLRTVRASMALDRDGKIEKAADGKARMILDPSDLYAWQRAAIEHHVKKVYGYTASTGEAISNGADLWKHGESAFVTEIADEVLSRNGLGEQEKKLSSEPSDSCTQTTRASDGTAPSAEQKAST